jgi:hypothetical protein
LDLEGRKWMDLDKSRELALPLVERYGKLAILYTI